MIACQNVPRERPLINIYDMSGFFPELALKVNFRVQYFSHLLQHCHNVVLIPVNFPESCKYLILLNNQNNIRTFLEFSTIHHEIAVAGEIEGSSCL